MVDHGEFAGADFGETHAAILDQGLPLDENMHVLAAFPFPYVLVSREGFPCQAHWTP